MTTVPSIPDLYSGGHRLDPAPDCLGRLVDSSDVRHNPDALRERMDTDGYLLIRDFFDRDAVVKGRRDVLTRLASEGLLDPDTDLMLGKAREGVAAYFRPDIAMATASVQSVIYGDRMMRFMDAFLGEPSRHYDYTWMRTISPGKGTYPHCDIVYMGRGTPRVYTAWVPFADIDFALGGLMVLEGSHHRVHLLGGYTSFDVDTVCQNPEGGRNLLEKNGFNHFGAITYDPVELRGRLGGRWLTEEYRMGDLLLFSIVTVHASLDNRSDRIRISTDSRYQAASEPIDERWVGEEPPAHGGKMVREMIC
ncbi:MAG: phytanoyl-CoA dioxygenase family protein [Fimbriimonadaceae bacterium]